MPRVINENPNAPALLNGYEFREDRGQWISEELEQEVADHFASIPGFSIVAIPPRSGEDGGGQQQTPAQKRAAEKEAKRIADEAEAKRVADEAEAKRLADEEEKKKKNGGGGQG